MRKTVKAMTGGQTLEHGVNKDGSVPKGKPRNMKPSVPGQSKQAPAKLHHPADGRSLGGSLTMGVAVAPIQDAVASQNAQPNAGSNQDTGPGGN